jgi:hypothetical protein
MATEITSFLAPSEEHDALALQVRNHLEGFRVLQPFLDDPEIKEVWINGPHSVFVAAAMTLAPSNHGFHSVEVLETKCSAHLCRSPGRRVLVRVGVIAPLFSTSLISGDLGEGTRLVVSEASGVVSAHGGLGRGKGEACCPFLEER